MSNTHIISGDARNIATISQGLIEFGHKFRAHQEKLVAISESPCTEMEALTDSAPILAKLDQDLKDAGQYLEGQLAALGEPSAFIGKGRAERLSNANNFLAFLRQHRAFPMAVQREFGDEPELNTHFVTMMDSAIRLTQEQIKHI